MPSDTRDWAWLAGLLLVVALCWAWVYDRFDPASWSSPIAYQRDGLATLAFVKLYAQGEFLPFGSKTVLALNAPAVAHWNDYPTPEELVFAFSGLLARLFGLYAGTSLSLLAAHLLAAASFFYTARVSGARPAFAFVGGLAFATCHFLLRHSAHHLILVHCWHLPLLVAISIWVLSERGIPIGSRRHRGGLAVAAAAGAMNPYFSAIFLHFLGLAVLLWCVRREFARVRVPLQLMLAVAIGFVLANADTFSFAFTHGWNSDAVARSAEDLERYALEPVELFVPRSHRLEALTIESSVPSTSDRLGVGASYLGLLGIGSLLILAGVCVRRIASRDAPGIPTHFWLLLWVFAFSLRGGLNTILGAAGFQLLRSTDRYSVVVLVLLLLFGVHWLSTVCSRRAVLPVAALLAALVVWDQVLPEPTLGRFEERSQKRLDSDRALTAEIEDLLGPDRMVFQLPVMPFPEGSKIHRMHSYEPLRPFLNAKTLRFSFGAQKGRGWERWQRDLAGLPAFRMLERLEALGFDGLLIHRLGYPDRAKQLLVELARLGRSIRIESRSRDFVFVRLEPLADPERVVALPLRGLSPLEYTEGQELWWSATRSVLVLHSLASTPERVCLDFALASPERRRIEISRGEEILVRADLAAGQRQWTRDLCLELDPGPHALHFSSVTGPERSVAFGLIELRLHPGGTPAP